MLQLATWSILCFDIYRWLHTGDWIKLQRKKIEIILNGLFFCKVITLWFWVLLNWPGIKEAGDWISKFHAKFYWIVYPIEVAILLLYIVLFGFYLDNAFRIVSYVFFLILLISVSFHRFRKVHGYWLVLFAALPVILLWCIFFWLCFCCIIFMIMFCKAIFNVSSKDNKKDITLQLY